MVPTDNANNVFESKYLRGCIHGGRKILEGETTFGVGLHAEISVRVINRREGIKEQGLNPLNYQPPFLLCLSSYC